MPRHRLTFPNAAGLNAQSDLNDFVYMPANMEAKFPRRDSERDPELFSYDSQGVRQSLPRTATSVNNNAFQLPPNHQPVLSQSTVRRRGSTDDWINRSSEYLREQDSEEEVNQSLLFDQPLTSLSAARVTDWRDTTVSQESPASALSYVTLKPVNSHLSSVSGQGRSPEELNVL